MSGRQTPLQQAERHVLEGEERVTRQRALVERMERIHHAELDLAREVLEQMEQLLQLSREHLELEKQKEARRRGDEGADR